MCSTDTLLAAGVAAVTALTLAAAPAGAASRLVAPGEPVPYELGYGTYWREFDVVRPGQPNDGESVEVWGRFDGDKIFCAENKGGVQACALPGTEVTDLGWAHNGRRVTTDPVVAFFAPLFKLRFQIQDRIAYSPLGRLSSMSSF
ncbi:hypothetical protein V6D40_01405 [Corynebacterium sp. Q4381]|uniref:hypothetical protein n=1 Tax=Corynebacterium sp. Marseille-Q4381 TaxID=3121597 RepID=UPI002FE5B771